MSSFLPTVLALETSAELASAAVLVGERLYRRESAGVLTHSQTVLPMVQSLLAEAGLTLAQCDVIGFGLGPGSFTGVRTACGITQGLAFGAGLPVAPVVTLLAMAEACRIGCGALDVLAILDARMGEVYWAQYRYRDGWQEVLPPALSAPAGVLPQGEVQACGNGLSAYAEAFADQAFAAGAMTEVMPHAVHIAQLARTEFVAGRSLPAEQAQPLYLRNKVAQTIDERLLAKAAVVPA